MPDSMAVISSEMGMGENIFGGQHLSVLTSVVESFGLKLSVRKLRFTTAPCQSRLRSMAASGAFTLSPARTVNPTRCRLANTLLVI